MMFVKRRFAASGVLLLVAVACSPAAAPPSPTGTGTGVAVASPTTPVASVATASSLPSGDVASATPSGPSGVVAIGHSGLTGEGTGAPSQAVPDNSWATGTNADVNSVYLRLKAVRPDLAGEAVNTAHGGAPASELEEMAVAALGFAPRPAVVIIASIDSDIHCDGTDAAHVKEFGGSIEATLNRITSASPDTKVLIVGQLGKPSVAFVQQLIAHDPNVAASLTGTGMCDFLDASGKPVKKHFETLTGIIDSYEHEQARVCALFPQCMTDGGVRAAYKDDIANFSPDYNHLNIKGQAAAAELIWPVVVRLLKLPT
jgi:hypothetical protein